MLLLAMGDQAAQEISCFLSTIVSGSSLLKRVLFCVVTGLRIARSLQGSSVEKKAICSQMRAGE